MMPDPVAPDDRTVTAELTALERRGVPDFLAFSSLASARKYHGLYRLCRRHVPAGATVLGWGAGNGHFSYFLVRNGYRTTSYSLLPCGFADWLPDGDHRFVAGNLADPVRLPFADAAFDAVASVGVLEHVRETGGDEAQSLAEIARVLRPGGVFVCWHFANQWSWIDLLARAFPGKHRHEFRFTRGDIRRLVAGAGLELLETRRYGVLPRNSLHRLLGPARDARWAANLWDGLDAALGVPLNLIAQNHCFVARRPAPPAAGTATRPAASSPPAGE